MRGRNNFWNSLKNSSVSEIFAFVLILAIFAVLFVLALSLGFILLVVVGAVVAVLLGVAMVLSALDWFKQRLFWKKRK